MMKYIGKLTIIMFGMVALFTLLQTLAFCIPDNWILSDQKESLNTLQEEGTEWEFLFTYGRGAQLDNSTDKAMVERVDSDLSENTSALYKAMDCNGYARYWHGYLVFLRPLMLLFSYTQIRYIYMFLYLLFVAAITMMIGKRINEGCAYSWVFSLAMIYFIVLPFSLQFSSIFFVMFISMIAMDKVYKEYNWKQTGIIFLIIGMITSYVDFLTAPLLTLGIPLAYLMLLQLKQYESVSTKKNIVTMLVGSITWGIGYFGNWFAKWVIASIVLKQNIILNGFAQGMTRMGEDEEVFTNPLHAIAYNIFAILPPGITSSDLSWLVWLVGIAGVILLILAFALHKSKTSFIKHIPFMILSIYPYLWYCLLSNHSSIHYIYTYRLQMISVWCLFICIHGCFHDLIWMTKKIPDKMGQNK